MHFISNALSGTLACLGVTAMGLAFSGDAAAAGPARFDGDWATTVICAVAHDGAKGYRWQFVSHIHGNALIGQFGVLGAVNSGTLTGRIKPNGDAELQMKGLTGNSDYTLGRLSPGARFIYTADVHFEGSGGNGHRNEARECSLDFRKM